MKKSRLPIAILAAAVLLIGPLSALAYDTLFQSSNANYDNIGSSGFRWFGTTYLPQTGQQVCSIGLALGNNNSDSDSWDINFRSGGTNPDNGTLLETIATTAGQWPTSTTPGFTAFDLASCHTLTSGGTYFIEAKKNGGAGFTQWKMGKNIGTSYPELTNVWTYNGTTWSQFSGTQPLAVQINGNSGNSIAISYPTILNITDFTYFILHYNSQAGAIDFNVDYATSSSNLSSVGTRFTDTVHTGATPPSITATQVFDANIAVPKTRDFNIGEAWYMQARLVDASSSTQLASSTITTMNIQSNTLLDTLPFLNPIVSNSTSTDLILTCDPNDGLFTRSFCNLFQYLFVPPQSAWNGFKQLRTDLEDKPPFGYITSAISAISGLSDAASSTVDLPDLSALDDDFFTPIKTFLSWVLYVLTGFWVYNKFRHFKF